MMDSALENLYTMNGARSARCSTWDRTGGNADCFAVGPGETKVLAEISGPGCIRHLYATHLTEFHPHQYREAVLRMYWDGEETPSVEVPFGDFFGIAHGSPRAFDSHLITLTTCDLHEIRGRRFGYNCYFPMPFAKGARIEIHQQADTPWGRGIDALWFHVDYDQWNAPPSENVGRFHAQWRRENPTVVVDEKREHMNTPHTRYVNTDGAENYVILEARGEGCLAGLHLQVDNIGGDWYGEGDDMIFIDGESWPPSIHGTGTEEVFAGQPCPNRPYTSPYAGFHVVDNPDFARFNAMYRWYVHDPVRFRKSVRWTIEHGHANNYENDYTSVAYWYQIEPHAPFPVLPPTAQRLPRYPEEYLEAWKIERGLRKKIWKSKDNLPESEWLRFDAERKELAEALRRNRFSEVLPMAQEIAGALDAKLAP